ncbi:MAG: hypothetical protein PHT07_21045 [Paludibacter sp.]|nr:hypothetical protein [Paludibacter sp.]
MEIFQTQGLATLTNSQFLTVFTIQEVNKLCRKIDDYPAILEAKLPTLASVKKRYGFDFIQAYIEGWIVNLREFINVGKKMTDLQCQETAMLIIEEYPSLTIADINLIFKKAKLGKYGSMYDRLDGQMILSWFEKHFDERCAAAANLSMREADRFKKYLRTESFEQITNLYEKKKFK